MKLSLKDIRRIPHLEFRNSELLKGKKISGVSTDSRTLHGGEVFFALKGEQSDGHAFLAAAFAKGAALAITTASGVTKATSGRPMLVVEDTTRAFGDLARIFRAKFDIPVIGIAGSNGKTTTKDMIGAVLSSTFKVLSTKSNYNNHIGVPLTLFRLGKKHEIAVVELGTNHPGELQYLCSILDPTHGLVTNIGAEHLEFFHTLEGVAKEEGVLYSYLAGKKKGVAFVNADDPAVVRLASGIKKRVTYGVTSRRADVRGRILGATALGAVRIQITGKRGGKAHTVTLGVPGAHNAHNAVAAAAVGEVFRVPRKKVREALEAFQPVSKRMEMLDLEGVALYNDAYNANPDSMFAALQTLAGATSSGKKIAVLGDMLELGTASEREHRRVGEEVGRLGIEYLLTYGEFSKYMHDGVKVSFGVHYDQKNILAEYLAELIAPGDVVLVKGSRGMRMEDIVTFLEERLRSAVVPFG